MLRVTCQNCKHEFESSVVNPGKVAYRGCQNVFQLEFNVKIPCPNCKNILGLSPTSPTSAKGLPSKEFKTASIEKTQSLDDLVVKPALSKISNIPSPPKVSSSEATKVKPFKVLSHDIQRAEPLRLHISKDKKAEDAGFSRKKHAALKPLKFMLYAASALIVSSVTAFTMFTFKNSISPDNSEIAMESLGDDEFTPIDESSELAMGGPTEDLVVDKAEEAEEFDLVIPEKYKKNILYLPDLKKMSSGFGIRLDPFTRKMAFHGGVDFKGAVGEKVSAALDGIAIHAGPRGRYGKIVIIDHGNGLETRYAHLSRVTVKKGQKIKKGQVVGKIGNTGRSTGPHLHLEVWKRGQKVNPLTTKIN